MRVMILAPEPPPRGVLHALVALQIEPVVARAGGVTETDGMVRYERVTARGNPADPMDLRWSRKALRTLVRDLRPDLLHLVGDPWTPTAEVGAAAARDLGIPYVLVGTSSVGGPKGMTARWQSNRVRDGAAALAGITKPALDHLAREATVVPGAVIPQPGIEIPGTLLPREPGEAMRFGVFGRLVPERGLDMLFDALAEVYGEWRVRIVGTGPSQVELEAQAQRLGLSSRLEWLGGLPRDAVAGLFADLDAIVAPSRTTPTWVEPTGSLILEAMAHGLAPVVSRCGALPDVVGDAGMVVEEEDRTALARALQRLVEEPARARELGSRARQRVLEHYGDGPIAEKMAGLWRKAVGGGPSDGGQRAEE